MKPDIIILDEPAAALDPKHTTMVNQIVNRMTKAGITVFMATHDVNYAYEWADQVILFHQGKVLMQGAPEEVFSNPRVLETKFGTARCVRTVSQSLSKTNFKDKLFRFQKI